MCGEGADGDEDGDRDELYEALRGLSQPATCQRPEVSIQWCTTKCHSKPGAALLCSPPKTIERYGQHRARQAAPEHQAQLAREAELGVGLGRVRGQQRGTQARGEVQHLGAVRCSTVVQYSEQHKRYRSEFGHERLCSTTTAVTGPGQPNSISRMHAGQCSRVWKASPTRASYVQIDVPQPHKQPSSLLRSEPQVFTNKLQPCSLLRCEPPVLTKLLKTPKNSQTNFQNSQN